MLKQLIQLFAEKFLVSKKDKVQDWTNPKNNSVVSITIPANAGSVSYVAPSNGMVQAEICYGAEAGYSVSLFVARTPMYPRTYFTTLVGWSSHNIRVAKGDTVKIECSKYDSRSRYYFIPFN